ncbi:hypothetical protein Dimus_016909 [Dionaea muscipula]
MEARRWRRSARGQTRDLLPLSSISLSNTVSCWYCDLKTSSLNEPLYRLGQKYSRYFRIWFTMGIGFSTCTLAGVTVILILELARIIFFQHMDRDFDIFRKMLFGFSPTFPRVNISFLDVGNLVVSTVIAVAVHEFGHALAAASEAIQIEYFAVFIAGLFPGALVAFSKELLEEKSRSTALRIYCAGIWHNALCCAACGVTLLLLPSLFSPFYIHGEGPMVLHVSSSSPLSNYLSLGDIVVSLDDIKISNAQDWIKLATLVDKRTFQNSTQPGGWKHLMTGNGKKGFCVPSSFVEFSEKLPLLIDQPTCPDELTAFAAPSCSSSMLQYDGSDDGNKQQQQHRTMYCLNAADIVKFKGCKGLQTSIDNGSSSCSCSEGEMCLSAVQRPGIAWVEITYQRPSSHGCSTLEGNTSVNLTSSEARESCHQTFLYVGDMLSMAESVWLTSYQPRWSNAFGAYLPDIVERILMCTFNVSLTLGLLNSLPVYFLDGESILAVCFCYLTFFGPRQRRIFLHGCLFGGSAISCLLLLRTFLNFW